MLIGRDAIHPDFGPSVPGGWPQNGQLADNVIECALVDHLLGIAATRLTDRNGDRHAPPWDPKQHVRIGVLRPRLQLESDEEEANGTGEQADTDHRLEASDEPLAIGVDFVVAASDQDTVRLTIDVEFALYQPLLPSLDEIRAHVRDQATHEDGEQSNGGQLGGPTRIPVTNAWQRTNVSVPGLQLEVPADGRHISLGEEFRVELGRVVGEHFDRRDAARPFVGPQTVAVSALGDEASWRRAIEERVDTAWQPVIPTPVVDAFAEPLPDGSVLVSVSLINGTITTYGASQDHTLYDCRLRVRGEADTIVRQRFNLAPDDYRYYDQAEVIGHGRNCVAVETDDGIRTDTLPRYVQRVVRPREDHVPTLRWTDLAADPQSVLKPVEDAMREYLEEWDRFLGTIEDQQAVHAASSKERSGFAQEIERFALGRKLLRQDHRLDTAFRLANRSFALANEEKDYETWRLFQLVYIVSQLGSLAAREHADDQRLADELNHADVLWFPTGGGKTEAYLGLLVVAAFYDRLRGKHRGVTAWLRFPLRMLSVQQLARVLRVLVAADQVRMERLDGLGAPFELGYLVGSGNTPNSLLYSSKWWPGIGNSDSLTAEDRKRRRLIAACPHCGSKDGVGLKPDPDAIRLLHECEDCERTLPIHMSDDEVYRYQPTVVVSTSDKITGYAHFGDFTSFNWGPAKECPDHGFHAFGCLARTLCNRTSREMRAVTDWHDPVPSLIIQDELHLVREELGTFSSHFEGLITELQRGGPSGTTSKILAATATIEQFEDQLRQVYGRYPRRFPSPGFTRRRSFYTEETPNIRRIFLGVMPTGGGTSKVEVAGWLQSLMVSAVTALQDDFSTCRTIIEDLSGRTLTDEELRGLLFNYETSLSYVNNRGHGSSIADDLRDLGRRLEHTTGDHLQYEVLTGDVPITELAAVIDRIEEADLDQLRSERLRALVGTSVVSHGVDISRLNVMMMTGMPSTVADYIQATSRSGRTHVGTLVTVFDHFARREASSFTHFDSMHRFLERMVEPVPVNKYARHAVDRTLPAIIMALLWDMCRNPDYHGPADGIYLTRHFSGWWKARAAMLEPLLRERIDRVYRAAADDIADENLEDQLAERAQRRWMNTESPQLVGYSADKTKELFLERVMTSLRDVDEAVGFSGMPKSNRIYDALI